MAPVLYMVHPSPPVRAVRITAKAIGLKLEEREINLNNGDHLKPEFLKVIITNYFVYLDLQLIYCFRLIRNIRYRPL